MRRMLGVLSVLVVVAVVSADAAVARQSYCSPSGDYCTAVTLVGGKRTLRVGTFAGLASGVFRGRVTICVDPPRGRPVICIRRAFVVEGSLAEASAVWRRAFPNGGHGIYRVRFYVRAANKTRLGPTLSFRV